MKSNIFLLTFFIAIIFCGCGNKTNDELLEGEPEPLAPRSVYYLPLGSVLEISDVFAVQNTPPNSRFNRLVCYADHAGKLGLADFDGNIILKSAFSKIYTDLSLDIIYLQDAASNDYAYDLEKGLSKLKGYGSGSSADTVFWAINEKALAVYKMFDGEISYDEKTIRNTTLETFPNSGTLYYDSEMPVAITGYTVKDGQPVNEGDSAEIYMVKGGKLLSEQKYDACTQFYEGVAAVHSSEGWQYIKTDAQPLVPYFFADAVQSDKPNTNSCSSGYITAKLRDSGAFVLLKKDGTEPLPFRFTGASQVYKGRVWVKQEGKWGVLSVEDSINGSELTLKKPVDALEASMAIGEELVLSDEPIKVEKPQEPAEVVTQPETSDEPDTEQKAGKVFFEYYKSYITAINEQDEKKVVSCTEGLRAKIKSGSLQRNKDYTFVNKAIYYDKDSYRVSEKDGVFTVTFMAKCVNEMTARVDNTKSENTAAQSVKLTGGHGVYLVEECTVTSSYNFSKNTALIE